MSTDIAGLAAPVPQRPVSMASSSSGSSNTNPFFDDMAYLDQVVEVETTKKPRIKWTARRKAESMTKSGTKPSSAAVIAKVRPQRSMANIVPRAASPPPTFIPYRPPSPTHVPYRPPPPTNSSQPSFASTLRPISPSRSPSPAPGPAASFPSAPVFTLSSDSEPDMPSLFDELASLDTAISSAAPKAKLKAKKKEHRTAAGLNAGMSKLKLLKSSSSLGRSSRSSDAASTARASVSLSNSSGSSFTFTRSRSSLSSRSTNTVTSLATITTSAHTSGSDPTASAKAQASPPQLSLPTVELAPQLPPMAITGTSTSSSTPMSHTPSNPSPQRASTQPQLPDLTPRAPNLTPSRPAPAPPVLTSPRRQPLPLSISSQPVSIPITSPSSFSSYPTSSPPLINPYLPSSPPPFSSYRPSPTTTTFDQRDSSRRYSNGWYSTSSQRRPSLNGRKGSSVERQGSVSSLAPPGDYRRPSSRSMAESPCLSIIGNFPVPPDIQLDVNHQLDPGSTDHLVAQLAAVAEHESREQAREPSAVFLDEYMAFVSTPNSPNPGERERNHAQRQAHEGVGQEHSLTSEGTTASPTLLTPEVETSTLSVPWARPLSIKRSTSSNSLMVEAESARPESVMLPRDLVDFEHIPATGKHSFEPYEATDVVDPLTPAPVPVPPPRAMSRSIPAGGQEPPARRETFGQLPTLPGMPLEKSPARAARLGSSASTVSSTSELSSGSVNLTRRHRQDSAASSYSASSMYAPVASRAMRKDSGGSVVSASLSPTASGFPGVSDTLPLNIRVRDGSGSRNASSHGRLRTAAGATAPLNVARSRTASNSSSDARGGYGYSTSYDCGMASNIESLSRFNMSGHDVTRIRANSGGARLASTRPRRGSSVTTPSSVSSASNSVGPTPPGSMPSSTPHTPGMANSSQVYAPPPSYGNFAPSGRSPTFVQAYSPSGRSPTFVQAYSQSAHGSGSYNQASYEPTNGTSYNSYSASYGPSSYTSPQNSNAGGHSHMPSSSSISVPSSGWYSSHGPTSPRSQPRRPNLPREARDAYTYSPGTTAAATTLPTSARTRGEPF
ncbi:uncharacterized protein CcaverHIS019_0401720 [Cutaneotrichosporon cavernicola]|uniref:Uncharacterized protein n=1 Tax=Cutaneotrichosporon cavernicola TaxID=279322 RepID=A0AA48QVM7_9TREE|nr:uncharacterized protein CcaverHIS019_0401720 [Cutaneotrichosporon cavernicola]BEI91352.1 hypothetical protein CcaverHIS019_0401720 [Cutaneotrichosporon cavernicola]